MKRLDSTVYVGKVLFIFPSTLGPDIWGSVYEIQQLIYCRYIFWGIWVNLLTFVDHLVILSCKGSFKDIIILIFWDKLFFKGFRWNRQKVIGTGFTIVPVSRLSCTYCIGMEKIKGTGAFFIFLVNLSYHIKTRGLFVGETEGKDLNWKILLPNLLYMIWIKINWGCFVEILYPVCCQILSFLPS